MKNFYNLLKSEFSHKQKIFLIAFALLLFTSSTLIAQINQYSFAQSSGTFTPLTNGTILGAATGNAQATSMYNTVYPISLPFNFVFNNASYSALNVSTNGYVTFGATPPTATNTSPISTTAVTFDGVISAWGRSSNSFFDINGTKGDISWETIGTAPNREVVIQWKDFRPSYSISTTVVYSFSYQIRLQETSNNIQMVYTTGSYLVGSTAISGAAQIGLRGSLNTDYINRLNATTLNFNSSNPGITTSSTQAYHTVNATPGMPTNGLTYTWTPPSCYAPMGLNGAATSTSEINLTWAALPSAPSSYEIYHSLSDVPPTFATTPTINNLTSTSTLVSGLSPGTVYYFWIRANCGGLRSIWTQVPLAVSTKCQAPALLSTTGATVCTNASATLTATADAGAVISWYDASTGGNLVGNGSPFNTPPIATTTNYWVGAATVSSDGFVGKTTPTSTSGNTTFSDYGLYFDAYLPMVIKEIDLYPMHSSNTTGTVTVNLKDPAGIIIATKTVNVNVSSTGVLNTVTLNFDVPAAGTGYRLVVDGATGITNLIREISTGFAYPYTLGGVCSITSARFGSSSSSSYYYYLYNWKVASKCESPRTMVTATEDPAACLSTSETGSKKGIKVYPNPFSEVLNISDVNLIKSIRITDVTGRLINIITQPTATLRLENLSEGMYILVINLKDGTQQTTKVIKK